MDNAMRLKSQKAQKPGRKFACPVLDLKGSDGRKADVYLIVDIASHPDFERKEDDLYTDISIDLYTRAVLGGQVRHHPPRLAMFC